MIDEQRNIIYVSRKSGFRKERFWRI